MYICKICGRKFKKPQSLAAHVAQVHGSYEAREKSEMKLEEEAKAISEEKPGAVAQEEELSEISEAEKYAKEGYSVDQLVKKFGFSKRTARRALEKVIPPENEKVPARDDGLPVVRRVGKDVEMVNPEAIVRTYLAEDGAIGEAMLKGMMLYRAAQLMVMDDVNIMKGQAEAHASLVKPILQLMEETRKEQDAAAQRARESVNDAALAASRDTAERLVNYLVPQLDSLRSQVGQLGGGRSGPLSDMLSFMQNLQQLIPMAQGLTSLFFKPAPQAGGAGGAGGQFSPSPAAPQADRPQGPRPITRKSADEWEEADD